MRTEPPDVPAARCGRRLQETLTPPDDVIRIASVSGAEEAMFGDWPHMCIILRHTEYNGDAFDLYQCGASLISPGIVLTAAHCVAYV